MRFELLLKLYSKSSPACINQQRQKTVKYSIHSMKFIVSYLSDKLANHVSSLSCSMISVCGLYFQIVSAREGFALWQPGRNFSTGNVIRSFNWLSVRNLKKCQSILCKLLEEMICSFHFVIRQVEAERRGDVHSHLPFLRPELLSVFYE